MRTEIKTQAEAIELLSFLSTAMSLSPVVQRQCKEAMKVFLPGVAVDTPNTGVANAVPLQSAVGWATFGSKSYVDLLTDLIKIHALGDVGRVHVFRRNTYNYHVLYEKLPSPLTQKLWTIEKKLINYYPEVYNFLINRTNETEVLYVSRGVSSFIYRRR